MTLIDFSIANAGEIGKNQSWWFSDLFRAAVLGEFTGGILITAGGDRAVFFDGGRPVHASGQGYSGHYLGEILLREGIATEQQVAAAVARQPNENPRPLLGALLVKEAKVDATAVKRAMQIQTRRRIVELFALSEGHWKSAPGKDARIFQIGIPVEPWPILLQGLMQASDRELRASSELLLGKGVQLARDASRLEGFGLDDKARRVLRYLEKPRKPDQLERAMDDRKLVRALLRLLAMEDALQLVPAAKSIPIPKATLLKGAVPVSSIPAGGAETFMAVESEEPKKNAAPVKAATRDLPPIAKELRDFQIGLTDKNYFELFQVAQNTAIDLGLLRKTYTNLAKKFHPDAFSSDLPQEVLLGAREVSAHINEAYETLSDEKRRAEYLFLLADDRIKGDARKAELIRDAETKSKMGTVMLKKREFQKAREFFKYAAEADPTTGAYKASLAWAMFSDPDFDKQKALDKGYQLVLEALSAKTIDAQTHYIAGQLLKARDENKEAEHHFKSAVRLDDKHSDAQRELRLIEMRSDKKSKRGGGKGKTDLLSKLFKRD